MGLQNAPSHEMLERCHRNYVESWWEMTKLLPGAKIERWQEATALSASVPSELANTLFVMKRPDDAQGLLIRARSFFSGPHPWRIVTNAEIGEVIGEAVGTSMNSTPGDPGLLLSPIPSGPPPPASLRVERVTNQTQLSDFEKAISSVFGVPMFVLKRLFPHAPTERDPAALYVGYEGIEPVASAEAVVLEGIAGIFDVGVKPRYRNRGYGRAITWAAVESGRERGCDSSYLQSSKMGLSMYQRMGFQIVSEYPEWHASVSRLKRTMAALYFIGRSIRGL